MLPVEIACEKVGIFVLIFVQHYVLTYESVSGKLLNTDHFILWEKKKRLLNIERNTPGNSITACPMADVQGA